MALKYPNNMNYTSENVIETIGLTKRYGSITAVNNLNISIKEGEVFGILGPNGSGKTTTLGMLAGVTNSTSGSFTWFGQEANAASRRKLGIILERPNFYPYMSAYKNLQIVAAIKEIKDQKRINDVLQKVGLFERRNDRFKTFSLGMKQRLSIASALLVDPKVLVLDEPTNGLDPQGIAEIRELIIQIANEGKTIIIASHLLDEVQKVCTSFMVLRKGDLMHIGPVTDVAQGTEKVEIGARDMQALETALNSIEFVLNKQRDANQFLVALEDGKTTSDLNKALIDKGVILNHLVQKKRSLEQKFLEILAEK